MSYTNKEVASLFRELGKIMEIHGESPFKTRAYENAYRTIRSMTEPVAEKTSVELQSIPGIGKAIADKTVELMETGKISALEKYREKTPPGVVDMLQIKGLGPKKIKQIWTTLGIESVGELLYACNENRLVTLDGVGLKTQKDILAKSKYYLQSRDKMHYAKVLSVAQEVLKKMTEQVGDGKVMIVGDVRRQMPVIAGMSFMGSDDGSKFKSIFDDWTVSNEGESYQGAFEGIQSTYVQVREDEWGRRAIELSSDAEFLTLLMDKYGELPDGGQEEEVFNALGCPYILPARRESRLWGYPELMTETQEVTMADVKGVIHAHSTYSDGGATLAEMAEACRAKGYTYLGITDHSKAAFYANGLEESRVKLQWSEIDELNEQFTDFRIFKGIEADILSDGSIDYGDEFLEGFDFVIASVHSVLNMDEERATARLIAAIEHPATTILGHPTGRLLLSREGYPIQHKKVIDAASANGVAIEINANPYRLDLDWKWIPYALEKGVPLSINPDAHSIAGIDDIQWGIPVAIKGGAKAENLLCCKSADDFAEYISRKK